MTPLPPAHQFAIGDVSKPEFRSFYDEHGFCVVRDVLSSSDVSALNAEAVEICRGNRGWTPDPKYLSEEEIRTLSPEEIISRFICIHFPHKTSDLMLRYLSQPSVVDVLTSVIGPNVKCMQSMLFIKAAGKPGQAWHQDEDYIPTRDRSLTGAWMALDEATIDNGCLWIIPGSHKPGILWPQAVQHDDRFDCSHESFGFPYSDDDAIPVEVSAGSVVFFNGYTLHRSLPNRREIGFRRTLVNHYMSAESFLPWRAQPGVPVAKCDYRDIVMVAGQDPYAWKGLEDIQRPHVRPFKQGGCNDGLTHEQQILARRGLQTI